MALVLARILDESSEPLAMETVAALFVDGYGFGDRLLEGVPFRITTDGETLAATMILDESIRRALRINREEAEADAVAYALCNDLFHLDAKLSGDGEGVVLRTHQPADEQMFSCEPSLILDGAALVLPPHPT